MLINGEPNSGKTTALLTFPGPRVVLSYPGEGGYDTLPDNDPTTTKMVYISDKLTTTAPSSQIITEVEKATVAALQTPGLQTFCGDGLHKLATFVMDAMSGGQYFEGATIRTESASNTNVLDPRVWGQTERWLFNYLHIVKQSAVPNVVFTCWDQEKAERKAKPGEQWSTLTQHRMPALPGNIARTIMGEFTVIVNASRGKYTDHKTGKETADRGYRWQTKSDGDVWGCAIKAPVGVVEKIPKFVKADWRELAAYLGVTTPEKESDNGG